MKDKDRQVLPSLNGDADLPERLWLYDDFTPARIRRSADFAIGPGQPGVYRCRSAALRARCCVPLAIAGMVCGVGFDVMSPPSYQASTTILLTHNPDENPVDAMQTDMALAKSQRWRSAPAANWA